ncbi:MAG: CDP-archaeol synthase [Chromatiales bacterium]|nr:MAG: CDP-archaeol synthase [Chromatiales bacterium]
MSHASANLDAFATAVFLLLAMSAAGLVHVWWLKSVTAGVFMQPLDFGHTVRGRRIFGDNKRVRGLVVMPLATAATFALLGALRPELPQWLAGGMWALPASQYALLGLVAGLAFMLAELPNSFLKRQLGIAPGASPAAGWPRLLCALLDRFDSVLGVLIVISLLVPTPAMTWLWVLLIGPGVHALFSALLHRLGVKARAL